MPVDVNLATLERVQRLLQEAGRPVSRQWLRRELARRGAGTTPARLNRALEHESAMGHVVQTEDGIEWRGCADAAERPAGVSLDLRVLWPAVERAARRHKVSSVRVFGSFARGEATDHSDVDLLIEPEKGFSVFDQVRLLRALREILGRDVDLVTTGGLHPLMRDRILAEATVP